MWLNVKQAAKYVSVIEPTLRNWMRDGLQHYRLSSRATRLHPDDIDAFIRRYKAGLDVEAEVAAIMTKIRRGEEMTERKPEPEKTIDGITFYPVPEFSDAEEVFGAHLNRYFDRHHLPEVPRLYLDMASGFFFKGGELPKFHEKVDPRKAIRALHAWLSSWAPAHEAKEATVAYALWLWTHETALDDDQEVKK